MVKAEKAFKWGIAIVVIFGILNAFFFLNLIIALKIALPILCVFLIGSILLQSGKGGGLAAIGGLGDQAAFGTRTSTFLTKITYLIGAAFIVATIFLFKLSINNTNMMNTRAARGIPASQHEHPMHEEEHDHDHEHAHPSIPHTKGETDKAPGVGMQSIPDDTNTPVSEQGMNNNATSESKSNDMNSDEKSQASNTTEKPAAEEQSNAEGNSNK